jgi:hypothetical protein
VAHTKQTSTSHPTSLQEYQPVCTLLGIIATTVRPTDL